MSTKNIPRYLRLSWKAFGIDEISLSSAPPAIGLRLCQMQRSRLRACAFSLLAHRLPIPFQCSPNWFQILRRRLHSTSSASCSTSHAANDRSGQGCCHTAAVSNPLKVQRITGVDLTRIDGVDVIVAQLLVREVGLDISRWKTEAHRAV